MAKSLRASNANAVAAAPGRRIKQSELVRIEVRVSKADAELLRRIASALADPRRAAKTRGILRQPQGPARDFKTLLASMPSGDIDLKRPHDLGRKVKL
jgi:hypothetical protein